MGFSDSYLGKLRAAVGTTPLIAVGVRVLVENDHGAFLTIKRSDDGLWGLPGGSMELGESLLDTVHREAFEEANVTLRSVTPFALSSDPAFERHTYPNGDILQIVSLIAHGYADNADIKSNDGEATDFRFSVEADIDTGTFVRTEAPVFGLWRKFCETGQFQIV